MKHFVIGTAGHIDHGKSALVKALTGTDPDRLEEEKRRGMTIDLGFAHFDLPSGRRVGIVDVPGHERLIRNMLAGATGIDLVMLVVAADEGVMPQTREHLDILRFLPVQRGVIVLNKIDLVSDAGWLALVTDDLRALTAGTFLETAPVLQVSARTGQGVPELITAVDALLDRVAAHDAGAPVRLPIDRAFVMTGFGTVVTGTLWSGRIRKGDDLELLPSGRRVRVRGLQSHGQEISEAVAGSRVAVNVVGMDKPDIARGNVLATPQIFRPTDLIDARVQLLPDARALAHLARIRMYVGSDEVIGRIALLDRTRLDPGQSAGVQLRLERPTVVGTGDPFVLRLYSPMTTIGGGSVVDPHPPRRRRTGESAAIAETPVGPEHRAENLVRAAGTHGIAASQIASDAGVSHAQVDSMIEQLVTAGRIRMIRERLFHRDVEDDLGNRILSAVETYHQTQPWRSGMPRDTLKAEVSRGGDDRFYAAVLESLVGHGDLTAEGDFLRRPNFRPQRTAVDVVAREAITSALAAGGASPPDREHLQTRVGNPASFERVFQTLLDDRTIVETAPGVYFHRDAIAMIQRTVADHIAKNGSITVASLRDALNTSRKFALTVLEYFDTIKFTRRVGDGRVLVKREADSRKPEAAS